MTIQGLIDQLQLEIERHGEGAVDQPLHMDSPVIFQDSDGNHMSVSIDSAGGNMFAPALVVTVY